MLPLYFACTFFGGCGGWGLGVVVGMVMAVGGSGGGAGGVLLYARTDTT